MHHACPVAPSSIHLIYPSSIDGEAILDNWYSHRCIDNRGDQVRDGCLSLLGMIGLKVSIGYCSVLSTAFEAYNRQWRIPTSNLLRHSFSTAILPDNHPPTDRSGRHQLDSSDFPAKRDRYHLYVARS